MPLILNTDIESKVIQNIKGNIARVGGSVDQLVNYDLCEVTDINIIDGGFGDIKKFQKMRTIKNIFSTTTQYIKQELAFLRYGKRIARDRKTVILDMHYALWTNDLKNRFDSTFSSNVIEHSPNPVFLLLNFHFITKKGGYQFHAIPNFRFTYDKYRCLTKIDHLISDFEKKTWFEDKTHNDEYIDSAIIRDGWQKKFHDIYPVKYPFIHYHVFDENNTRELFEFMFEEVTVDIIKNEKYSDNVVTFKNVLKKEFIKEYLPVINEYSRMVPIP